MSRLERNVNIAAVVIPFAGFAAALAILWGKAVGALDLTVLAGFYAVTGLGITVGFHRLLTHGAFRTHRAVRYTFAAIGSMAVEGPVIDWVADHRKHHAHSDEEGDPHSPHVGRTGGLRGILAGLWHAHVGWLFEAQGRASKRRYAPDLLKDRGMRIISRSFPLLALLGLAIPFGLGWGIGGTVDDGLTALLWGGLVRIFLVHHVTWSINSICHFFGRRRYATEDRSTNVFWLALPSFGEAWHHNHHAFPTSAFHGLRWWELDPSGWVISALARVGLAWNVIRPTRERELRKLVGVGVPDAVGTAPRARPAASSARGVD